MSLAPRANELALRKHLLLLEADIRRQEIALVWAGLQSRTAGARGLLQSTPWWAWGGGLAAAFFVARKTQGLARWIPTALAMLRLFRGQRSV
ncbi:MAG: hypothetical protein RIQ93_595 [Verrucomicrobiota bacterium]|jgi:hypothetical protein